MTCAYRTSAQREPQEPLGTLFAPHTTSIFFSLSPSFGSATLSTISSYITFTIKGGEILPLQRNFSDALYGAQYGRGEDARSSRILCVALLPRERLRPLIVMKGLSKGEPYQPRQSLLLRQYTMSICEHARRKFFSGRNFQKELLMMSLCKKGQESLA